MYEIRIERQAEKDLQKIIASPYKDKVKRLMQVLEENPFLPPYEKLLGDMSGVYSRRINIMHRLVYRVEEETKRVIILRMWTHYGDN